jgi:hypothetical protein
MKRKKPLLPKKALERKGQLRSNSGLKTNKPLASRSALKPRSAKTQQAYKERREFVASFLSKFPVCQVSWDLGCQQQSVDVHEKLFRSHGGEIVGDDPDQFLATCRYCHTKIHDNPQEAHNRGFRIWSWEK